MRKYVRHPTCVPVDIAIEGPSLRVVESADEPQPVETATSATMTNISAGGLVFELLHPVEVGARLTVSMLQVWPGYTARGTVAWCREVSGGYEAGVQFCEASEAFKARMVAQFCQIEDYRRDMAESEGRLLSSEEAAKEWIIQYAEDFADTIGWQ
jgi:hypothetical protein